jgi:hypothetical protein
LFGAVMGLATLAAPVSTAGAQAPLSISIFGGGVFPTGSLGDALKTGWIVGANVDHRFSGGRSPVSLRLDLAYGSSSFEGNIFDLKLNSFYGIAYALFHPGKGQSNGNSVDLYIGGGGGIVIQSIGGSGTHSTDPVASAVVGAAVPVGSIFLFFEGRWVLIFSEGSTGSVFPVVAGIRIPLGG